VDNAKTAAKQVVKLAALRHVNTNHQRLGVRRFLLSDSGCSRSYYSTLGLICFSRHSFLTPVSQLLEHWHALVAYTTSEYQSLSTECKAVAYKTLVLPKLEYAACSWDPYTTQ